MYILRLFLVLGLAGALNCSAELSVPIDKLPMKGTFYVSVDDGCTIYINGKKVYSTGIGESRSPEMELKVGDRMVVNLRNDTAQKHFLCVFATADGDAVVSFRHADFKIVPDLGVIDFTPEQFQKWPKLAKEQKGKGKLPVKSASEEMWGDMDKCIIAGTITSQMVSRRVK